MPIVAMDLVDNGGSSPVVRSPWSMKDLRAILRKDSCSNDLIFVPAVRVDREELVRRRCMVV